MALSYAAVHIANIDPTLKTNIDKINTNVASVKKRLQQLHEEREAFTRLTTTLIKNHVDMMINFVFENGISPKLNLEKLRSKNTKLDTRISNLKVEMDSLFTRRSVIIQDIIDPLRTAIITDLQKYSVIKEVECAICFIARPPVILKFPCSVVKSTTDRPGCWMNIFLTCARIVTGLTPTDNSMASLPVKCPNCPTTCIKFTKSAEAYTLNMQLIATVDMVLSKEIKVFYDFCGEKLNPIFCHDCDEYFQGLFDLHHHMHQDCIGIQIEIPVKCCSCNLILSETSLRKRQCENCEYYFYY